MLTYNLLIIAIFIPCFVSGLIGLSGRFYGRKGSSFLVVVGMGFSFFFFCVTRHEYNLVGFKQNNLRYALVFKWC